MQSYLNQTLDSTKLNTVGESSTEMNKLHTSGKNEKECKKCGKDKFAIISEISYRTYSSISRAIFTQIHTEFGKS